VGAVEAASPAGRARIRHGVEIVSIDGISLAGVPLTVADALLNGTAGTVAVIEIRSSGRTYTVSLPRATEFDAPRRPLAGAVLEKLDGGTFQVLRVSDGSAPDRAGLVPRDEIVTLNGISAESLTPEEAWEQMREPTVAVSILRRGRAKPELLTITN